MAAQPDEICAMCFSLDGGSPEAVTIQLQLPAVVDPPAPGAIVPAAAGINPVAKSAQIDGVADQRQVRLTIAHIEADPVPLAIRMPWKLEGLHS